MEQHATYFAFRNNVAFVQLLLVQCFFCLVHNKLRKERLVSVFPFFRRLEKVGPLCIDQAVVLFLQIAARYYFPRAATRRATRRREIYERVN